MIRISNVTKGTNYERIAALTTKPMGTSGEPVLIQVGPGENKDILRSSLHDYHAGVKQRIVEFMAQSVLRVFEITSVHLYQDKGHVGTYGYDYLIDVPAPLALQHALDVAGDLHDMLNGHILDLAIHNAPAVPAAGIAEPIPTDLPSLINWISVGATAAQTQYPLHIASAGTHVAADATNTLTPIVAVDLPTSVAALRELHRAFNSHREWVQAPVTELTVAQVAVY